MVKYFMINNSGKMNSIIFVTKPKTAVWFARGPLEEKYIFKKLSDLDKSRLKNSEIKTSIT